MNKLIILILLLTLMVKNIHGQDQTNKTVEAMGNQRTSTPFIDELLKFFGISDSPTTLKAPGDEVVSGELWLTDLDSRTTRALSATDGYRSPIFLPGTKDILVLRGIDVVRVPYDGGEGKKLCAIDSVIKLVGAERDNPGTILVLLRGGSDGHPRVGFLILSTGAIRILAYDVASGRDLQMVESLETWSRTYGNQQIYVKRQTKQALSGTVEWSEVFLKVGNRQPMNVSRGDGVNCGQPSLSENGNLVVFIKAKPE